MNKGKIEELLPEPQPNNEQKGEDTSVHPSIAKPPVVRSPLLKDYMHLFLGCNVFIDSPNAAFNKDILDCDLLERLYNDLPIDLYKLILRPLSDMTEDEAIELTKPIVVYGDLENVRKYETYKNIYGRIVVSWGEGLREKYSPMDETFFSPKQIFFLLSNHFDLFGLIDAGLAINAVSER